MRKTPITRIDTGLCTGCGTCVKICPSDTLSIRDGKAVVTGDESMRCAQCAAVCPEGAVHLEGMGIPSPERIGKEGFSKSLVDLMMSRRSCRRYKTDPVDPVLLEDLVTTGAWAPSGTNSQGWRFTIIPDRTSMLAFAREVAEFFRWINKTAENPVNRFAGKLFFGDRLSRYYREYYDTVKQALEEWDRGGRDRLFHGATAGVVISTTDETSCPVEDALMAAQNIVLAAHAEGLGTCLVGFAVEAMARRPSIGRLLGIPAGETVRAVIAVGHPAVTYPRPSGRIRVEPRIFRASEKE